MRHTVAQAEVGDVYGDNLTVRALERTAAQLNSRPARTFRVSLLREVPLVFRSVEAELRMSIVEPTRDIACKLQVAVSGC